jgi:hypothetical protein
VPRARNLKPSFFKNETLAELPPLTRILFAGLWTLADREGRLEDRPAKIKAEVLPYDTCKPERMLQELHDRGFIQRYEVEGVRYIQVLAFSKHQNPHVKEVASTIPAPGKPGASTVLVPEIPAPARLIPDSGFPQPDSLDLTPDSPSPMVPAHPAKQPRGDAAHLEAVRQEQARAVWQAYGDAYENRYGTRPLRNGKVNSCVLNFLKRVPAEEAPHIAAHYLRNNSAFYVAKGHDFSYLLADAEKLRTEWATGNVVTATQARQADRTAATGNTFGKLINEQARNGTQG